MSERGRPFVWEVDENEKIVDESIFDKVASCAAQGLTKEQTAHALGIHYDTFNEYQKRDDRLAEAYKVGKSKGIATVTNALFQKAKSGDNTAMIFFLKNRDPENWEDVQKRHIAGHDGGSLQITEIKRTIVDPKEETDGS